jgi:hypothetical protein
MEPTLIDSNPEIGNEAQAILLDIGLGLWYNVSRSQKCNNF